MAIQGDLAVVGISPNASNLGAAYLFSRTGGFWTLDSKFQGRNPVGRDLFGHSVDLDGGRAISAGFFNDQLSPGVDAGSAFIFPGLLNCSTNQVNNLCDIGGGDCDQDGDVDLTDYASLFDCLSGPGAAPSPADPTCVETCFAVFDIDGDGAIGMTDVAVLYDTGVRYSTKQSSVAANPCCLSERTGSGRYKQIELALDFSASPIHVAVAWPAETQRACPRRAASLIGKIDKWKRPAPLTMPAVTVLTLKTRLSVYSAKRTFAAFSPFSPRPVSNSTLSLS